MRTRSIPLDAAPLASAMFECVCTSPPRGAGRLRTLRRRGGIQFTFLDDAPFVEDSGYKVNQTLSLMSGRSMLCATPVEARRTALK
jgi:hypothetical protein